MLSISPVIFSNGNTGGPCHSDLLFADSFFNPKICYPKVSLDYQRFFIQIGANKHPNKQLFGKKQCYLVVRGFGIRGTF
jgi:hypothetical protein